MGFITDALKQSQSARRSINLLVFLRKAYDGKIVQPEALQFTTRSRELAFSSIDNDEIRETNERLRIPDSGKRIGFQPTRCVKRVVLRVFGRNVDDAILVFTFRSPVSGIRNL